MVRPLLSQKARRPGSRSDTDEIAGMTCPRLPARQPYAMMKAERGAFVSIYCDICHRERNEMKSPRTPKVRSVSLRLTEREVALIDRAAAICGRSRTEFVRETAIRAAQQHFMPATPIHLSLSAFEAFSRAVSAPATPVPELVASLRHRAPWGKTAPDR